jgi:F-type H+-transporting ATPase subunit beta
MAQGKVSQVNGPVVDVRFPTDALPPLLEALRIPENGESDLIIEVAQHLGDDVVRCVAMDSTDGLVRGMAVCGG